MILVSTPGGRRFHRWAGSWNLGPYWALSSRCPMGVLAVKVGLAQYRFMSVEQRQSRASNRGRDRSDEPIPRDGRAARTQRTRAAVADALLELLEQGELRPTSRMIAERAGVSERTIFQHFEDLENLFSVAAHRLGDRVFRNLDFIAADGLFERRLTAYLDELTYLHESVTPVRRASRLHEPFSPVIDRSLRSWRESLRKGIERVFATELMRHASEPRRDTLEALALVATWSSWENMRNHSNFSVEQSRRVLEVAFRSMLNEADSSGLS